MASADRPDAAPPEARSLLHGIDVFGHPEGEELDALVEAVEWLRAPAGSRLFSAGDAPDGMYVILGGRVRFYAESDSGPVLAGDVGPGYSFGEGSLLAGGGRSRSAVVARDALLARLAPERFLTLMQASPALSSWTARMMAARVTYVYEPPIGRLASDTTLLVPFGVDRGPLARHLADDLARASGTAVRNASEPNGPDSSPPGLIVADRPDESALARAVGYADRILMVADADAQPTRPPLSLWDRPGFDPLAAPPVEIVVVHQRSTPHPVGTAAWLRLHPYARHHHIRRGHGRDLARLVRHLDGRAVGLVLGGGGARGMAHIGVIKALEELAIPVDHVGGSSIGAIVGGQVAMGWSWREMMDLAERRWASRALQLDLTLPTVSVSSGRRARRILEETFGDLSIEDFWLPAFCTTVNLSRFRLDVHHQGRASRWIRASASAPGLWPPVVDDSGELHIDGGQLNNVPTDVMRREHVGPIIAVDVCAMQSAMTVPFGTEPPVGVRHLLRRRFRHRYPSLVDTLNRCALLGSLQHREQAADFADIYLTPELGNIGFSGFRRVAEAVDIGYQNAMSTLGDDQTLADVAERI
jgi:predicted acylesterase/phospholipase RssA/CRP-like cAMP-binding protein